MPTQWAIDVYNEELELADEEFVKQKAAGKKPDRLSLQAKAAHRTVLRFREEYGCFPEEYAEKLRVSKMHSPGGPKLPNTYDGSIGSTEPTVDGTKRSFIVNDDGTLTLRGRGRPKKGLKSVDRYVTKAELKSNLT